MTQAKKANELQSAQSDAARSQVKDSEIANLAGPADSTEQTLASSSSTDAGRDLMTLIMLYLSALALAFFLFSFLGRYFFLAELLGNFRLQLSVLMVPLALTVFRIGRWRWLALSLIIATGWSFFSLGSVYFPTNQPPAGPKKLRIMSFNVLGYNPMRDEVIEEMHKTDPDVIMVLEYTHIWHGRLSRLDAEYPHQVLQPRWHGFGMAVFSKYPLSDTSVTQLTKEVTDNPLIITNVSFGEQKIRLCGAHVLSPTSSLRLELRNQQYDELAQELGNDDVPTVVLGDFNSVPWSPFVNDLLKKTGYRDSRQGFGFHASWHAEYPILLIPIDHAFVSDDICVHSRTLGSNAGSDHLPIIVEVSTAQ